MRRSALLSMIALAQPAAASWTPADETVAAAARTPEIAAVLAETDRIDAALVADDHAAFAARLADDLAVNDPQNRVNTRAGAIASNVAGRISYHRLARRIEYAGLRGGMVVLMGEERVVPKRGPAAGQEVVRRFTDLWRRGSGRWRLTARQATIIPTPTPPAR